MSGRTPDEGRYSKITRRMWDDEVFRGLSAAPPNGQTLWQRLLTGPELGCIPGLYAARLGGLAEALKWPIEDTKRCWEEIESAGLAQADWTAGLVWVPNAIVHNAPQSVNAVLGWRLAFRELPECALKRKAIASLRRHAAIMGESWLKAFDVATGEPKAKASPKPRGKPSDKAPSKASDNPSDKPSENPCRIQEQEQEQEQDSGIRKEEEEPAPPSRFSMHLGWVPKLETVSGIELAGVAGWAIHELVGRFRAHFVADQSKKSTDSEWNQRCAKWVIGDWRIPSKRPEKPQNREAIEWPA